MSGCVGCGHPAAVDRPFVEAAPTIWPLSLTHSRISLAESKSSSSTAVLSCRKDRISLATRSTPWPVSKTDRRSSDARCCCARCTSSTCCRNAVRAAMDSAELAADGGLATGRAAGGCALVVTVAVGADGSERKNSNTARNIAKIVIMMLRGGSAFAKFVTVCNTSPARDPIHWDRVLVMV